MAPSGIALTASLKRVRARQVHELAVPARLELGWKSMALLACYRLSCALPRRDMQMVEAQDCTVTVGPWSSFCRALFDYISSPRSLQDELADSFV